MSAACLLCDTPIMGHGQRISIKLHFESEERRVAKKMRYQYKGLRGKICGGCYIRLDDKWLTDNEG